MRQKPRPANGNLSSPPAEGHQPCTALLDTYPLFLTAWTCENLVAIAMASILRAGTVLLASKNTWPQALRRPLGADPADFAVMLPSPIDNSDAPRAGTFFCAGRHP